MADDRAPVNLKAKFEQFAEQWQPRVIAELNDYQFKIVRLQGEFVWHEHADTDEAFLVIEGEVRIEFERGAVTLRAGELYVVPKGTRHKPVADREAKVLLVEPRGVRNTGGEVGARTAADDLWI